MLDGLLGRSGFYSKCKSLIKQTRTRIEVVRRKRNATQKFLRNDIADLLANNLDANAFARADGLITELILTSCYEFIDHVCEIVLKHLPVLQKLRDCPEDCREAVASLMFAAARFSDLPELRDVRDLFQERYGSSLEFYVNQKLVENITTKPPSVEKKVQLLQDIALEFSIRWDGRSFQERMSSPVTAQIPRNSPGTLHVNKNAVTTPTTVEKTVKDEALMMKKRSEASHQNMEREVNDRHQIGTKWDSSPGRKDDLKNNGSKRPESTSDTRTQGWKETVHKPENHDISSQRREHRAGVREFEKNASIKEAAQIGTSSNGRRTEPVDKQHKADRQRQSHVPERDLPTTLSQQKPDPRPTNNGMNFSSPTAEEIHAKSMRRLQSDLTDGQKSNFRGSIPPPYLKPRRNKHKTDVNGHREEDDTLTFKPATNGNRADKLQMKADSPDPQDGTSASENGDGPGRFTEIYYKNEVTSDTPRRRSHRRRHSRSASSQDDNLNGEERVVRRVSTSRRKHESRKGLQILVGEDERHQKDDEERMIDKLLLHYSKKPSSSEAGKSRRKSNASKSPHHKAVDATNVDEDSTPTTSRSFSLPSRQVIEPKPEKVFTRAASFQPDTPAKHVHPKLPDYDDLAARFAALRACRS